jgi:hypothetical protein
MPRMPPVDVCASTLPHIIIAANSVKQNVRTPRRNCPWETHIVGLSIPVLLRVARARVGSDSTEKL